MTDTADAASPRIVGGKSDMERAAGYRAEIAPMLTQLAEIMSRAGKDGLIIGWGPFTADQFGRFAPPVVTVTKPL